MFDEPLSNLDAALRVGMRMEISELHKELSTTMIYVTHDQVEAMTLADKIVVLRGGVVEQVGAPLDLYDDPDNKFVAGFIGSPAMNFLDAVAEEGQVRVAELGNLVIPTSVSLPDPGGAVTVGIRPEHLTVTADGALTIDLIEHLGGVSYVYLSTPNGTRLIAEAKDGRSIREGGSASVMISDNPVYIFDDDSQRRLR